MDSQTLNICDVILHVTAIDQMCHLFQFKYQTTPYYGSDEDKIFTQVLNLHLHQSSKF